MAYTSAPGNNAAYGRIKSAASTLFSDNQSLISEIRKSMIMMKEIAVDMERDNESEMVKELEAGVIQLLEASDQCTHLSTAIQSLSGEYQPGPELTDFGKLFEDEIGRLTAGSSSLPQNHPWLRQFREAIWNVHHPGQPMPGEEQEDIVMTSTQCNLLNVTCPLSGKPVIELADPVRSMDCKHIYEKKVIMRYIRSKNSRSQCPVAGCPKMLRPDRVVCDPLLLIEIDEMRSMNKESTRRDVIEDFTELDEED
ncbi:E3 SUMO-protein ligase MMS21 [Olea europaea var. sylvestris]|uniref:E3 SUMO-protein ligase MMS21 n=1 Tax=Olea europaea var. sylvestris TaxID=158386 RepID=UPI000C1D41A5|nr:E3 SUMO-protein ligase MMS21 [Olea europaea var. sylvestris]